MNSHELKLRDKVKEAVKLAQKNNESVAVLGEVRFTVLKNLGRVETWSSFDTTRQVEVFKAADSKCCML